MIYIYIWELQIQWMGFVGEHLQETTVFFGAPQDPAVSHWSDDPLGQDSHNGLEWMLSPLKHGNWKAPTSGGFSKGKSGKKGMLSYLNSMFFTVSNTIC